MQSLARCCFKLQYDMLANPNQAAQTARVRGQCRYRSGGTARGTLNIQLHIDSVCGLVQCMVIRAMKDRQRTCLVGQRLCTCLLDERRTPPRVCVCFHWLTRERHVQSLLCASPASRSRHWGFPDACTGCFTRRSLPWCSWGWKHSAGASRSSCLCLRGRQSPRVRRPQRSFPR